MQNLQERLLREPDVAAAHDAAVRIDGLERQLREWCEWHLMARYGCTLVQAQRIMRGDGLWPRDAPSDAALVMRTIRYLSENRT